MCIRDRREAELRERVAVLLQHLRVARVGREGQRLEQRLRRDVSGVQSFKPGEITPEEANRLGVEFAKRFTKGNHCLLYTSRCV